MELRVWVDGVQRIVCGVRLTTTCQEIVFVLAKATHQAGRFTMIERWRNNERLLSPNEQPLVTLQRWGEHMNEVEFILKKASSEIQSNPNQGSQPNRASQLPNHTTNNINNNNHDINTRSQQQIVGASGSGGSVNASVNPMRSSPISSMQSARNNQQQFMNTTYSYQPGQYNLNRRPQTSLGSLTSSSSALGIGSINYSQQQMQKTSTSHPLVIQNSLSTSTLPDLPKQTVAPNSNNVILPSNAQYIEEQLNSSPSSLYGPMHNGYLTRNESNAQHYFNNLQQVDQQVQQQATKNHPFEELYSTINKKRVHNPPVVPAKPRVVVPMTSMANNPSFPPPLQPTMNNAQANYFNNSRDSPSTIFHNNLRPRHPPGYSDYLEAIASRNSSGHSVIPSSSYLTHTQHIPHSNNLHSLNSQQANNPGVSQSYADNRFHDNHARDQSPGNYCSSSQDVTNDRILNNSVHQQMGESGSVTNPGSAANVELPSSDFSNMRTLAQDNLQRDMISRSVSKIGHDMLKMIEEQKKVLLNQKNELDRLDNDRDYWETKQNSEQVELVNRIENEIHQLEELWRENQAQISKLEYQDLEKEVQDLKTEQIRIQSEIKQQRNKLTCCEDRITLCKAQIDKLESELATYIDTSSSDSSSAIDEAEVDANAVGRNNHIGDPIDSTETATTTSTNTNGTTGSGDNVCLADDNRSSDDLEDDSEGDYSDDLNLATSELKLRAAKEVAYVDKRGLISGIRSLKLDKSKAALSSRQPNEQIRFSNNSITDLASNSPNAKDDNSTTSSNNNNTVNNGCSETNGQYSSKTATSSNQYEFLMTL